MLSGFELYPRWVPLIRNELASEQLIKVQFQVAMSGRYISYYRDNNNNRQSATL